MTQWEYHLASLIVMPERPVPREQRIVAAIEEIEDKLDELGRAGWEAVGPVTVWAMVGSDQQQATMLLLKRPAEPEDEVP
jgi:hypothetical protein